MDRVRVCFWLKHRFPTTYIQFSLFRRSSLVVFRQRHREELGGLCDSLLFASPRQPGENPEVMGENCPIHLDLAVLKSFGSRYAAQEHVLKHCHTGLGLGAAANGDSKKFILSHAPRQFPGIPRADSVEETFLIEHAPAGFALKASVGHDPAKPIRAFFLHPSIPLLKPFRISLADLAF